MLDTIRRGGLTLAVVLAVTMGGAGVAEATVPAPFQNCTQLHRVYPHGVGKVGARDKTVRGARPVTTWKRNTAVYNKAMKVNRDLDRDRDGIACEKK